MNLPKNREHLYQDTQCIEKLHTLTQFIDCIDVSMTSDQLLYHALYCQPCRQDQRSRAVIHTRVKISSPVSDQNLGGWEILHLTLKFRQHLFILPLMGPISNLNNHVHADVCLPGIRPVHLQPLRHEAVNVPCCPERWHLPRHPAAS